MDDLWDRTQDPAQHQRWDMRFGTIEYLTKDEDGTQRFTYATSVAPGLSIGGTGESLGDRNRPDGTRWSGLKFWAADQRSIIDAGAGYWRYVPTDDGVRFLTRYDYRPRWGRLGEVVDKYLFRPLFGWATAWSFDRLRLWLEEEVPPERSRDLAIAHATAIAGMTGVWLYQGIVPKLWKADDGEVAIWEGLGLSRRGATRAVRAAGLAEVGLGLGTLALAKWRWPFVLTVAAMPMLAAGAGLTDRSALTRAFNPASLNLAVAALAGVAIATTEGRPSGSTSLRRAPDHQPEVGDLP